MLETGLKADFALVKAWKGDTIGNLVYKHTAQNFNPLKAAAAGRITIAEVEELVLYGQLDSAGTRNNALKTVYTYCKCLADVPSYLRFMNDYKEKWNNYLNQTSLIAIAVNRHFEVGEFA